jgi:hypothetical protein
MLSLANCNIEGCDKAVACRGFCWKHYMRLRRRGDPLVAKTLQGLSWRDRFDAYFPKDGGEGCWEWKGSTSRGYGVLKVGKGPKLAHRLAWEVYRGELPDGAHVLHRCDNPRCVRPEHLFIGDQVSNMADKMAKKRHRYGVSRGAAHGRTKLTDEQVKEIRATVGPARLLAAKFGISMSSVQMIRSGQTWRHLL